jgi:hypothetical protein
MAAWTCGAIGAGSVTGLAGSGAWCYDTPMSDKPSEQPPPHSIQIQIEIDPATANGTFVNMAMVNHTDTEFTLDLIYVPPQQLRAVVRARAITTPKHMKRLLHVIQDNLARYEARFGVIDLGDAPHFPGGVVN